MSDTASHSVIGKTSPAFGTTSGDAVSIWSSTDLYDSTRRSAIRLRIGEGESIGEMRERG
jgi:hypothetical protein